MNKQGEDVMRMGYEEVIVITAIATVTFKAVSSLYDFLLGALSRRK